LQATDVTTGGECRCVSRGVRDDVLMPFEGSPLSETASAGGERLAAAGEMRRKILARDWSKTPLGPPTSWPSHLHWMLNMILDAGVPMALVWGEQHHLLYNDLFAEIIQDKHPAALGAPAAGIFQEIWTSLSPLFARAMGGEAVVGEDLQFNVTRHGVTKPGFFSFSYSPLARLLVARGLEVVQADSAQEAFEKARNQQFDLVISDIGLPDQSGYEVMKTLRAQYGFRGVALSGYGTEQDIARSKEAGFSAHLTKPISADVLDEMLDQFVAGD
jgi:CheY-like chemotaxis protein